VLVVVAVPRPLLTDGLPKAAILHLGHRNLGKLALAVVAEVAVAACSAVPLAGEQSRDPIDIEVEVGRLLQIAGVALGDTVLEVALEAGHGPCCGRGYPSARPGAAAHRLQVQKGVLRPAVQHLLHEGHQPALPYQSREVWLCPEQVGGFTSASIRDTRNVTNQTDQVGQLCCRSSHERRQ
jgi:hypothetical protein